MNNKRQRIESPPSPSIVKQPRQTIVWSPTPSIVKQPRQTIATQRPKCPSFHELNEDSKLFKQWAQPQDGPTSSGDFPHFIYCKLNTGIQQNSVIETKPCSKFCKKQVSADIFIEIENELVTLARIAKFGAKFYSKDQDCLLYVLQAEKNCFAHVNILQKKWDLDSTFHVTVFDLGEYKENFVNNSMFYSKVFEFKSRESVWYDLKWDHSAMKVQAVHRSGHCNDHNMCSERYKNAFLDYLNNTNFQNKTKQIGGGPSAKSMSISKQPYSHSQIRSKYEPVLGRWWQMNDTLQSSRITFESIQRDVNQSFVYPVKFLPPVHKYFSSSIMGDCLYEVILKNQEFSGSDRYMLARYQNDTARSNEIMMTLPLFNTEDGLRGYCHLDIEKERWESESEFSIFIGIPTISESGLQLQDIQIRQVFKIIWERQHNTYGYQHLILRSGPCSEKVRKYATDMATIFVAYLNHIFIVQDKWSIPAKMS